MTQLAIFDLDNTIISGDCDIVWGQLLIERKLVDADIMHAQREQMHRDYSARKLDVPAYYQFMFEAFAKLTLNDQQNLLKEFYALTTSLIRKDAIDKIKWHYNQQHTVIVTTASAQCLAEGIVRELGINFMLATTLKIINERYTNKVVGTPNIQEGKVDNLKCFMKTMGIQEPKIWAYSDSLNDQPLLELAEKNCAYAVTPSDELRKLAEHKKWHITYWS